MRAALVVIANVVEEKSPQMAFVHRNNVIQQLSPTAFDPALRCPVLPGTLERGLDHLHPEGSHGSGNLHSVLPVSVEDQKPRSRAKRKGLPQLLHNPQAGRMLGDVAVQDTPPVMSDHEKAVQYAKPDGGNREEIHRSNHFLMVAQKRQPSFTWLGVPRRSFDPAGDRPFRDVEPVGGEFRKRSEFLSFLSLIPSSACATCSLFFCMRSSSLSDLVDLAGSVPWWPNPSCC